MRRVKKVPRFKIIKKKRDNGFYDTKLSSHLDTLEVGALLFMGINADCCVMETAEAGISSGFKIITASDLLSGMRHHSLDNSRNWYIENGTFYEKIDELIDTLTKQATIHTNAIL